MEQEILAYIEYLADFWEVKKPQMPNFDLSAYTDNEYKKAIEEVNQDYENINDFDVYLRFLKGE